MSKLKIGVKAPNIVTEDIFEAKVNLDQFKGRKVLLSFYRYASCPLCNLRVNDLIRHSDNWSSKGLDMIAVFQSPAKSIKQYVGKQDAPFPIIPDPEQTFYKKYGVSGSWGKFLIGLKPSKLFSAAKKGFVPGKIETDITMVPADFLIDEKGIIHTVYYGKDASDHLDIQLIEGFVNN